MPKLIKNKQLADNPWTIVGAGESIAAEQLAEGHWILPLGQFLTLAGAGDIDPTRIGVWLASDDDISALKPYIKQLQLIALNFAAFGDGRAFSQARSLREHYDYSAELRALGNYIQDQMFYLSRCGVNAFLVADDANIESLLHSLSDFSDSYQAACDEPQPLFRRRA